MSLTTETAYPLSRITLSASTRDAASSTGVVKTTRRVAATLLTQNSFEDIGSRTHTHVMENGAVRLDVYACRREEPFHSTWITRGNVQRSAIAAGQLRESRIAGRGHLTQIGNRVELHTGARQSLEDSVLRVFGHDTCKRAVAIKDAGHRYQARLCASASCALWRGSPKPTAEAAVANRCVGDGFAGRKCSMCTIDAVTPTWRHTAGITSLMRMSCRICGSPSARRLMISSPERTSSCRRCENSGARPLPTRFSTARSPMPSSGVNVILKCAISMPPCSRRVPTPWASSAISALLSTGDGALTRNVALSHPRSASPSAYSS